EQGSGRLTGFTTTLESGSTKNCFTSGDVLFGKLRPYLKKFILAPFDGVCSSEIWVLTPKPEVDKNFLFHLVQSDSFLEQANKSCGTKMPRADWKVVSKYIFLLPPLIEQQKIAKVLSTVDQKIDLIDQKIAETQKLKTGLMQKLFSEGVGVQDEEGDWQPHTEFDHNGNPSVWSQSKLGSLSSVTSGGTPSRKKSNYWDNGDIPWITTGEIKFNTINTSVQKITKEGLDNSAAKLFPRETVLMAMYGQGQTRGRVALLDLEASTNQACAAIMCNEKLHPRFCFHYLASQYDQIRSLGNEGSQKNLNGKIIKDIYIPCPPVSEQKIISEVLDSIDQKVTLLSEQKAETQQLKKGLMQKLLTGEWRVPLDNQ
ncbi:hypothetical protein BCU63_30565, partial [Vibrio splendidus]